MHRGFLTVFTFVLNCVLDGTLVICLGMLASSFLYLASHMLTVVIFNFFLSQLAVVH